MGKFKVIKRLDLDFFGKEWEKCYMEFTPISVSESIDGKLMEFAEIDRKDTKAVQQALKDIIKVLKDHFLSGKGIDKKGEIVDIKKDDFGDLPAEILGHALGFLSQGLAEAGKLPSKTS